MPTKGLPAFIGTALYALILLFPLPTAMAGASGEHELDSILAALAENPPQHLRFRERRDDPLLEFPETREGRLHFDPPDHLERHMDGPGGETVRIQGDRVELERQGQIQHFELEQQPGLALFAALFRALNSGDRQALEEHFRITLEDGHPSSWRIRLVPREPRLQRLLLQLDIRGSQGWIDSIDIEEAGGRSSRQQFDRPDD